MTHQELLHQLERLRKLPHETEWAEFKEANRGNDFKKLGKNFSALSNEANLKNQPWGWLVFGVRDDRSICGSRFREDPADLDSLKHEIARETGGITFLDIHVVSHPEGRIVMFQIPQAVPGLPTPFQRIWYGRDGESTVPLSLHELETIRSQTQVEDWSSAICTEATLGDLDAQAIATARTNFRAKNQTKPFAREIDSWSDEVFLNRADWPSAARSRRPRCSCSGDRNPHTFSLRPWPRSPGGWKARNRPTSTSAPLSSLRPTTCTRGSATPSRKSTCRIAWYRSRSPNTRSGSCSRPCTMRSPIKTTPNNRDIIVTETVDQLRVESAGRFFEGQVSDYTLAEKTPQRYRNRFLADAMVNVNMIDTMGYGIRRMYLEQRKRFYPLPDIEISDPDKVVVTIHGKVIDPSYTATLIQQEDLPLSTVILLDQVQKHRPIDREDAKQLRRRKLVEGRYPNLFVAAHIASATGEKAQYIKNRAFDDAHYKQMIVELPRAILIREPRGHRYPSDG